jgi:molybdopterin-biosynthesis enzyme MoeA-like protein
MNNFEAKYMKISSAYLSDKLKQLGIKNKWTNVVEDKKESTIHRIVTGIFK